MFLSFLEYFYSLYSIYKWGLSLKWRLREEKKLDLENTRIKNINIIYRMAKRAVTKHRRKLRNNKSRSKRHTKGGKSIGHHDNSATPEEEETPVTYEDTSSSFTDIEPTEEVALTPERLIASVLSVGFIETEPT